MKSRNFDISIIPVTAAATADTEFSITHGFKISDVAAIPREAFLMNNIQNAVLYKSGTAWTNTTAYLKASVANAQFVVAFFG